MKKAILFIVLALFMINVSCGSSGGSGSSSSGSTAVTIRLGQSGPSANSIASAVNSSAVPTGITTIRVTVSADEMVTIIKEVSVAGQSSVTITLDVPNGPNRRVLVEALNASGNVIYSGESVVNLEGEPLQLTIAMSPACTLYVASAGADESGCTDVNNPCRTITFALAQTNGNVNICVAAGTYDSESGETFPITLKAGTGILWQGTSRTSVIVSPLGEGGYFTTILGAAGASISGCSITGGIDDDGETVTVNDCELNGGGGSAAILLSGDSVIKNSRITNYSGEGDDAIRITGGNSTLSGNTIDNNWDGISIIGGSPAITGNIVTSNWSGVDISGGTPVISGNNTLSCNTSADLENLTSNVIDATNNKWDHATPTVSSYPDACASGVDVCNSNIIPGSVNVTGSTQASPCPPSD